MLPRRGIQFPFDGHRPNPTKKNLQKPETKPKKKPPQSQGKQPDRLQPFWPPKTMLKYNRRGWKEDEDVEGEEGGGGGGAMDAVRL